MDWLAATDRAQALSPSRQSVAKTYPAAATGYTLPVNVILHIADRAQWLRGQAAGAYHTASERITMRRAACSVTAEAGLPVCYSLNGVPLCIVTCHCILAVPQVAMAAPGQ